MSEELVTVAGDVFVEQFRPVDWKRESIYGKQIAVYRSADAADALRTESPGGAAFLNFLLQAAGVHVQALLAVDPAWDQRLMFGSTQSKGSNETKSRLVRYQVATELKLNRIESLYVQDDGLEEIGKDDRPWRLQARVDELHIVPAAKTPTIGPTTTLVVDDYGRQAIDMGVVEALAASRPRTVVVSGQFSNRQLYKALLASADTGVLICSEREAIKWSEVDDPPIRFPPGSISDHKDLLRLIVTKVLESVPSVGHIIINRAGPPFSSLHVQCAKEPGDVHKITSYTETVERHGSRTDSTPGVDTYYLAAFVQSLLNKPKEVRLAVSYAVRAASTYETDHVTFRPGYFGRRENLNGVDSTNGIAVSHVISLDPTQHTRPVAANSFLRKAQIYGRLARGESSLPDYYAADDTEKQIKNLLDALAAYGQKFSGRPFNVLLTAEPGSGKSYFAQCLARHLERLATEHGGASGQYPFIEANLSSSSAREQVERTLIDLYETIRDHRAVGRTPVVLLDEFDTLLASPGRQHEVKPMEWLFGQMLAPLWDGAFFVEGRRRQLGGFVLLIAVSSKNFTEAMMKDGKGRDFNSRLDVRLTLAPTKDLSIEELQKQNILVAVAMLRKHFGRATSHVQLAVLDAISRAEFDGGNRAIDRLFMMSSRPKSGVFTSENLPQGKLATDLGIDIEAAIERYGTSFIEL